MGYPLRFPGTEVLGAAAFEADGAVLPGRFTYEITVRTEDERFFMRPDGEANEIILGCLGRAAHRYPGFGLHGFDVRSNHLSMLATPDMPGTMSNFMRDFLSTTATGINRLRGREGKFWGRRYRSIPIIGEGRIEERFAYLLTQGTKENLVWSADEWPGVSCIGALRGGKPLVGRWRDRTAESVQRNELMRKLRRAAGVALERGLAELPEIWREYVIPLEPLPHWLEEKPGELRRRVSVIVRMDAENTRVRHERARTQPLGVRGILETDPMGRPKEPKKSPAPMVHVSRKAEERAYRKAQRLWAEMVRAGNRDLLEQRDALGQPAGVITGPLPATAVVVNREEAPAVFVGGNPAMHYDPLLAAGRVGARPRGTGPRATGPPT